MVLVFAMADPLDRQNMRFPPARGQAADQRVAACAARPPTTWPVVLQRRQQRGGIGGRIADQQPRRLQIRLPALGGGAGIADRQDLRRRQRRPRGAVGLQRLRHRLPPLRQRRELPAQRVLAEAGADLRQHAQALDRPAARRQHAAPGHEQLAAVRQRGDRLHQPLAQGGAADHHAAAAVGQRGGQDLGGAGGAAIHHDDHRHFLGQLARLSSARPASPRGRGRR